MNQTFTLECQSIYSSNTFSKYLFYFFLNILSDLPATSVLLVSESVMLSSGDSVIPQVAPSF